MYARDAADGDRRFADLFRASSTSTGTFVAMAVVIAPRRALHGLAGRRLHPLARRRRAALVAGARAFVSLTVLYLVTGAAVSIGIAVVATRTTTAARRWPRC